MNHEDTKSLNIQITQSASVEDVKEIYGTERQKPQAYFESRIQTDSVFLAKVNDNPAGFLISLIWWGNCPFIELLKVKKEYQKQGIGTLLLQAFAQDMQQKNFKTFISSTETQNEMGLKFHKKYGFKKLNALDLPNAEELFFKINTEDVLDTIKTSCAS